jgi:HSP20 family molecular chaperone IbpA
MYNTYLLNTLINSSNASDLENYNYSYVLAKKKDETYTAKFNVAGFEKDEIKIDFFVKENTNINNRQIKVIAQNQEFGILKFFTEFPRLIDEKSVKASLKNGILTISCREEKIKSPLTSLKIEVE